MNPKKVAPMLALIFSSDTPLMTLRKTMVMTVAMIEATVTQSALRNVRMAIGRVAQREKTLMGMRNIRIKERQAEVRKRPNMTCETSLMRLRMPLMLDGRLTVEHRQSDTLGDIEQHQVAVENVLDAPANNSSRMISTGLNQYSVCGGEQLVTPSFLYPSQKPHRPTW